MAFITLNREYKGHKAMVVSAEKAKSIQEALNNLPENMTDEQEEFLLAIKHIYFGDKRQKPVDTSHLTNIGIQQSSYDAIPTGDR